MKTNQTRKGMFIALGLLLIGMFIISSVSASQNQNYPSPTQCNGADWNIGLPDNTVCSGSINTQGSLDDDPVARSVTGSWSRLRPDLTTMNKFCQLYTGDLSSYATYGRMHNYCTACDQSIVWWSNNQWNYQDVCAGTLNVQLVTCATGCHPAVTCSTDSQCNDNNANTEDKCLNAGTSSSSCEHNNIVCSTDSQCNDNNPKTEDKCLNAGTGQSSCQHNNIRCLSNSDCGTDGYFGSLFCQGKGIYQNYNTFSCSNPGTTQSSCSNSVTALLKSSCPTSQICSNAQCITTQCSDGIDNDLDGLTDSQDPGCWDNVNDPNTYNPVLSDEGRATISCFTNAQCGRDSFTGDKYCFNNKVYQDYKSFTCTNAGKGSATCNSNTVKKLVDDCPKACSDAKCVNIECSLNSDCNDNNLYTYDECSNAGTTSSTCVHTKVNCVCDNDCGITGFFGTEFCTSNDIFKNFQTSKCISPGTKQSNCQVSVVPTFLVDCGENTCGNFGSNYCKGKDVYHQRTCNNKGCTTGACFSSFSVDEKLVSTCQNGCSNGACKPECTTNSDCASGKVCSNNVCVPVTCSTDSQCNDNNPATEDKCLSPGTTQSSCQHLPIHCSSNAQCGTNGLLNQLFCKDGNVFDKYITYTCNNAGTSSSSCSSATEDRSVKTCTAGCQNAMCIGAECNTDSDCENDYFADSYCKSKDIYHDFHNFSCVLNKCQENVMSKFVETCDYKCGSGECKDKPSYVPEEEDENTSPLIIPRNVTEGKVLGSTSYSEDINVTTQKLGKNNAATIDYSSFLLPLIAVIILLIIILIIVFILLRR